MKFINFLITFFILVSITGFYYVFDFADAKLFGASLISLIIPQTQDEKVLPNELAYEDPPEQDLGEEVEMIQENLDVADIVIESNQDKIDDIVEKIDILQQRLLELEGELEVDGYQGELVKEPVIVATNTEKAQPVVSIATVALAPPRSSGGGANYPKILISEVQIEGLADSKEEFVELYNPNATDVDLTSWYLQRKTKSGSSYATFAPNTLFSAKKITSKGYFLIAREGFLSGAADIFVENPLTEDNSLILKNPNGEISDKVGWGQAQDFESFPTINPMPGYSIGRNGDEQDTNMNSVDFTATNPTPKAKNFPYVPPVQTPVELKDTIAPEVVFNISSIQKELSFPVNFTITDPTGAVSGSGIGAFAFKWKEESGEWQEGVYESVNGNPAVFSPAKEFSGSDEKTYYFQVKAKDVVGNESDWLPEAPATTKISVFKKVLINEVQTAGVTTKDEFVILYNPNAVDMNLAGFALKKKTATGTESNLVSAGVFSGTILAGRYFLIAPQDNEDGTKNYVGNANPDLRYSGKSFSIADNNTILLYNASDQLLDKVGFGNAIDFETAPTSNPPKNKSIIRDENHGDADNNATDFHIKEIDATAPIISDGAPEGKLASGVTQVNLRVGTNENAECKYSTVLGQIYGQMPVAFSTTDGLAHTVTVEGLTDGSSYSYYIRCADLVGNENADDFIIAFSIDSPEPEIPPTPQVVAINEIAWMGTTGSANDEWMELFNPGDESVDLTGWVLSAADDVPLIQLSGLIEAQGFYLLERTDDDSVLGIAADKIYTGALSNSGERLYLKDGAGNIIDEVDCATGWFAGDNVTKKTMQRKDVMVSGSSSENWQTSQEVGGSPGL